MPRKVNPLGPVRSTRLPVDTDKHLMERAKKAGLPPAFFMRAWIEKQARLDKKNGRTGV